MEKIVEQGLLYDFYGELLTEHQCYSNINQSAWKERVPLLQNSKSAICYDTITVEFCGFVFR